MDACVIQVGVIFMRERAGTQSDHGSRIVWLTPHTEPPRYEIIEPTITLENSDCQEVRQMLKHNRSVVRLVMGTLQGSSQHYHRIYERVPHSDRR